MTMVASAEVKKVYSDRYIVCTDPMVIEAMAYIKQVKTYDKEEAKRVNKVVLDSIRKITNETCVLGLVEATRKVDDRKELLIYLYPVESDSTQTYQPMVDEEGKIYIEVEVKQS